MPLLPAALYGLRVPAGDEPMPAAIDFPATIRITMAAIDPTEEPEADEDGKVPRVPRSTLKLVKETVNPDMDEDSDEDDDYLQQLLADGGDDSEDDDEEEANGGPSDPSKSKKARQEAALKKLLAAANEEDSDEEMADAGSKSKKSKKGKAPATKDDSEDSEEEDSDDDSDMGVDMEEHVLCTLDLERNFQQPLDIVIGEGERAYFVVTGTHSIHLTGNYVIPDVEEDSDDEDDSDDEYDLTPDMEDVLGDGESVSSDDLDEIDGAMRVEEIDTDDEEAPKLVKAKDSKKSKKRPAEDDEAEGLDALIAQEAESKLSKKQQKKLKNNKGEAVEAETKEKATPAKGDKKVQFAKNLEQGPTGSAEKPKANGKASLGVKTVQGITIDDRKLGQGRVAKSGDKVSMRYIGKLTNGKVFDANKKGPPFSFKLGKGEVIKGWDIGVAGMAVGGERRLTIPASHAYGSSGVPGIPGNSTLVFDVKLLEIK
ncbi:hypothetical protein PspLS_08500 [Pyricularia sp. CBS 133598]|nr:hypothetical protein PspLS_08500 [Pyricularia sp. CBS 133598]